MGDEWVDPIRLRAAYDALPPKPMWLCVYHPVGDTGQLCTGCAADARRLREWAVADAEARSRIVRQLTGAALQDLYQRRGHMSRDVGARGAQLCRDTLNAARAVQAAQKEADALHQAGHQGMAAPESDRPV